MTKHTPWSGTLVDGRPHLTYDEAWVEWTPDALAEVVTALNACAGINPEAVPEMVKALEEAGQALAKAFPASIKTSVDHPALTSVRAALAKAKEVQP